MVTATIKITRDGDDVTSIAYTITSTKGIVENERMVKREVVESQKRLDIGKGNEDRFKEVLEVMFWDIQRIQKKRVEPVFVVCDDVLFASTHLPHFEKKEVVVEPNPRRRWMLEQL